MIRVRPEIKKPKLIINTDWQEGGPCSQHKIFIRKILHLGLLTLTIFKLCMCLRTHQLTFFLLGGGASTPPPSSIEVGFSDPCWLPLFYKFLHSPQALPRKFRSLYLNLNLNSSCTHVHIILHTNTITTTLYYSLLLINAVLTPKRYTRPCLSYYYRERG